MLTEVVGRIVRADGQTHAIQFSAARASIEQAQAAGKHPDKKWSAASTIDADASLPNGLGHFAGCQETSAIATEKLREAAQLHAGDQMIIEMQQKHSNPGHILGSFPLVLLQSAAQFRSAAGCQPSNRIARIIKQPEADRKAEQVTKLRNCVSQQYACTGRLTRSVSRCAETAERIRSLVATLLVSNSNGKRVVRVLPRGNWQDESGPQVQPKLPAFFG